MEPSRIELVAFRSAVVTPDVAEALRHVEINAARIDGAKLSFKGTTRPHTEWPNCVGNPPLSLQPAGREVRLRLHLEGTDRQTEVESLWGIVVPLGFTPWNRYPLAGNEDDLFHFFGLWQPLYDHLCGEGRGELAWPSVCAAAQVDVGTWGGDKPVERFVQAQLHRLGLHCGPVDGIIGERTASALRAIGVKGKVLTDAAKALAKFRTPEVDTEERRVGHVILPGDDVSVVSYGKVAVTRTRQGVGLTVDGPGRVIINIGQEV